MGKLVIHQEKIADAEAFRKVCPFGAMELTDGKLGINAACKMCKLCVKRSTNGEVEFIEDEAPKINKAEWRGICVFVDHVDGAIHPVTFELIGKARELADKVGFPVYALLMGHEVSALTETLRHYPVDDIFVYDRPELRHFRIEPYTAVFADFVRKNKPSVLLVGATTVGRQLAPRVAARFRTGLTADCTVLDIEENTDLVQIRPAFGGNIMAQIATPNHRPQMATVRYKVMQSAEKCAEARGTVHSCEIDAEALTTGEEILSVYRKEKVKSIEAAEVIVVAGRGVKNKEDLALVQQLADALGGELASTRPLVEAGWVEPRRQIGLSGRTVRPKLIITCGVSGAVQFAAGMKASDRIIAINKDEKAPIFQIAHIGLVGNLYDILPRLTARELAEKEAKA